MNTLLRALLLRNRYCAPVGADGELSGGSAAEAVDTQDTADTGADVDEGDDTDEGGAEEGEGAESEGEGEQAGAEGDERDDDLVITLEGQDLPADDGDELPANIEPKASAAFAKMRADKKRLERENRELKAKQEEAAARPAVAAVIEPLGNEPTLEECDFDAEAYAGKLKGYLTRKTEHDARVRQQEDAQRRDQEAWTARLTTYRQDAAKLKRDDFSDAEAAVTGTFNTVQQGMLIKHPKAAALIYVLGKNPVRAKALAAITDPVDFAFAAADLAVQVKVERKSPPPPTDTPVRGRTNGAALASQTVESLRQKGRETGDYSAYFKAKRAAEDRKAKATA